MKDHIAIVGVGMHPFGRTRDKTGLQQGVHAARLALQDASVEWKDMQFGCGGSYSSGNADFAAAVFAIHKMKASAAAPGVTLSTLLLIQK